MSLVLYFFLCYLNIESVVEIFHLAYHNVQEGVVWLEVNQLEKKSANINYHKEWER